MAPLFPRWSNTAARVSVVLLLSAPAVAVGALLVYVRSPFGTEQGQEVEQPVQFDHRHHVKDANIDCRYCHTSVETSATAGIPSTATCMGCHSQVWNRSPRLEPVRAAYFSGKPIQWNRVHKLPDFVYFDHSIHVAKGVGCVTCHGKVDEMPYIAQQAPLTMGWCLDCHKDPTPHLRPREHITNLSWLPPLDEDAKARGERIKAEYQVHTRTSCTTCHR
jgi:hypothetical protein